MSEYNHESRIKRLERIVSSLELAIKSLKSAKPLNDFIPLSQAAEQLNCNAWVIRDRIKSDSKVQLGKHYQMNGNRYLINVAEYQDLVSADLRAKRQ